MATEKKNQGHGHQQGGHTGKGADKGGTFRNHRTTDGGSTVGNKHAPVENGPKEPKKTTTSGGPRIRGD